MTLDEVMEIARREAHLAVVATVRVGRDGAGVGGERGRAAAPVPR